MNKFTEAYAKARDVLENQVFESKWQEFLFADCQARALFAADGLADAQEVPVAARRAVRDQDVEPLGDAVPARLERFAARQVEGPVHEGRLPRRAVDAQALDLAQLVLQVDGVGDERARRLGLALEAEVVVAGDDDLVLVRQRAQVLVEAAELARAAGIGA